MWGDEFSKRLQAGVKWVSSIDIHPGGEGVCVCVCVCVGGMSLVRDCRLG